MTDWLNKLHNIECVKGMRELIPEQSIDLTITSPPYDDARGYKGFIYDFKSIAQELWRITKSGGVVVWNVNDMTVNGSRTGTSLEQCLYFKQIGFNIHDYMIYSKSGFRYPDNDRYYSCFEFLWILSKGKPKTIQLITDRKVKYDRSNGVNTTRAKSGDLVTRENYTDSKEYGVRYSIFQYNTVTGQNWDEASFHPAVFPLPLAVDQIVSWSRRGDTVLDCHSGSGTTLKAAKKLGRNFVGFEISTEYYQKSLPYIEATTFEEQLEMKTLNWNINDQDKKEKTDLSSWLG